MTGAELNWRVVLRPPLAPRWAEVTPAGVRLLTVYDPPPAQSQTIINTYPLRRHYDCSGKALESPAPGADHPQVPCLQSSQTNAPVQVGRSSNDGAILVPLKGVLDCYQVIQPVGPLFYLGQILVNSPQSSYILHKEEGGKLRLRLRENQVVLTTEKKTARGYRITLD